MPGYSVPRVPECSSSLHGDGQSVARSGLFKRVAAEGTPRPEEYEDGASLGQAGWANQINAPPSTLQDQPSRLPNLRKRRKRLHARNTEDGYLTIVTIRATDVHVAGTHQLRTIFASSPNLSIEMLLRLSAFKGLDYAHVASISSPQFLFTGLPCLLHSFWLLAHVFGSYSQRPTTVVVMLLVGEDALSSSAAESLSHEHMRKEFSAWRSGVLGPSCPLSDLYPSHLGGPTDATNEYNRPRLVNEDQVLLLRIIDFIVDEPELLSLLSVEVCGS
ncbi:MAG: hypothetical protein Q9187_004896 [Circinaria calcarea]